jgi:hypothetical protein
MSSVLRVNRKANDADIIQLNSLGLSLATIGKILGCHPTTITLRLKSLNIDPADTRRTFMEDIILKLNQKQKDMLIAKLGPQLSIKDYVRNLIAKDLI